MAEIAGMDSAASIDDLELQLADRLGAGRVFRPGDGAYARATALWNTGVTTRPALVVRPRTGAEVASAVTAAGRSGVGVSVRGGGHDWVGGPASACASSTAPPPASAPTTPPFGQRASHLAVEIAAGRGPNEDPGPYRKWVDKVSTALAPHALPGGYPNFLAPDQHEQIMHAYGAHAAPPGRGPGTLRSRPGLHCNPAPGWPIPCA